MSLAIGVDLGTTRCAVGVFEAGKAVTLLTDDERPLVFGKDGHLEYSRREGRENVIKDRAEQEDDR